MTKCILEYILRLSFSLHVSKRTYFLHFFEGRDERGIGTVGEAFTVLLGRGGEETRVGGGAFASRNPVVIPGWRGRALTRCRLNLLEISRQIPGLYPRLPCRLRASLRKIGTTSVSIAVFQNPGNAVPTN